MFNIVEKNKEQFLGKFVLEYGDIVVTDNCRYLVICDGWGQFYFVNMLDGFVVVEEIKTPYKVRCVDEYEIGRNLFDHSKDRFEKIVDVIRKEKIKIEVHIE